MPMTRSKAMVFAGQTCYGVEARLLVSLSSILSTRTASLTACMSARAIQRKHQQQPRTWRTTIPRSSLCTNSTQGR
eukprot:2365638-Pyramimonas_sp.AAC.1